MEGRTLGDRRVVERRSDEAVRQELLRHVDYIREDLKAGFNGIYSRLDTLDARVVGLEKRESGHHERMKALEEESDEPHQSKRRTAVTLSLGAGGAALLIKLLDALSKASGG